MNIKDEYDKNGFFLIRQTIPYDKINNYLDTYMEIIRKVTGQKFYDPYGSDLVSFYNNNRSKEAEVYDQSLKNPTLKEFSLQKNIVSYIKELLGKEVGLFNKIVARMDMPFWTEEMAFWHQDYFYVRGNTNTVSAWIPLQDTTYVNGCLSVMPRSHLLGFVKHDLKIGKKNIPSTIFNNEIRMVEMKKGDLLIFNALLLHSSNLNLASSIRYAIQPRYTRLNDFVDESMKGVTPI